MKKYVLVVLCGLMLAACGSKLEPENAKNAVMCGETENLPLLLQRLTDVKDITIDSIKLRCTDEPMNGYLYTTWTVKKSKWSSRSWDYVHYTETKSIIIKVDSIRNSTTHKGYIEWQTDWAQAYMDATR